MNLETKSATTITAITTIHHHFPFLFLFVEPLLPNYLGFVARAEGKYCSKINDIVYPQRHLANTPVMKIYSSIFNVIICIARENGYL